MHARRRRGDNADAEQAVVRVAHVPPVAAIHRLQATAGNRAVQRLLAPGGVVQRYRRAGAQNFGAADGAFTEQTFRSSKKQPWISLIDVEYSGIVVDAHGDNVPTGTATATYFANAHALSDFSVPASGGPISMPSDPGTFTVHRIEGMGYNDPSAAAAMAKAGQALEGPRRGKHRRYTKPKAGETPMDTDASMHLAVFYNRGEALHVGAFGVQSHGCVHVDSFDTMTQLNYHSVIGRTKVNVRYTGAAKAMFAP